GSGSHESPKSGKTRQSGKSGKGAKGGTSKGSGKAKTQKGPRTKASRRPQEKKSSGDLQDIPSPKVSFPLWIKFAIPTAFIITILLMTLGFLVSNQMMGDIERQVNKRGVDLVTQLSENVPQEFWQKVEPKDLLPPPADAPKEVQVNF